MGALLTATIDPDPALKISAEDQAFADVGGETDLVVVPCCRFPVVEDLIVPGLGLHTKYSTQ